MKVPWAAERVVDLELARALIAAQFPSLASLPLAPFGSGWDNSAFLAGGAIVFRFPRRQVAVPLLEREAQLLPEIAGALPLAVPRPEFIGRPDARHPWPFAGYRLLRGTTACVAALDDAERARAAAPLGRFLAALHAFPVARAQALGAPGDEIRRVDPPWRKPKAREALAELAVRGLVDNGTLTRLLRLVDDAPSAPAPPALVHGDLYARHILVDDARLPAGVIDWGDLHLGHRAVDLALAFEMLPPAAHDRFFTAYGEVDEVTLRLARFRAVYHAANVARFGAAVDDRDLLREGLMGLGWLGR